MRPRSRSGLRIASKTWPLDIQQFVCPVAALTKVTKAVTQSQEASLLASELVWRPKEVTEVEEDVEESVAALVEKLEELEDTLRVWTTLDQ